MAFRETLWYKIISSDMDSQETSEVYQRGLKYQLKIKQQNNLHDS